MNNEYNKQNNGGQNRQFNNNEYNTKPQAEPSAPETTTPCEKKNLLQKGVGVVADTAKSVGNSFREAPVKSAIIGAGIMAALYGGYKICKQIKAHGWNPKNWDIKMPAIFCKKAAEPAPEAAPAEQPAE